MISLALISVVSFAAFIGCAIAAVGGSRQLDAAVPADEPYAGQPGIARVS